MCVCDLKSSSSSIKASSMRSRSSTVSSSGKSSSGGGCIIVSDVGLVVAGILAVISVLICTYGHVPDLASATY